MEKFVVQKAPDVELKFVFIAATTEGNMFKVSLDKE